MFQLGLTRLYVTFEFMEKGIFQGWFTLLPRIPTAQPASLFPLPPQTRLVEFPSTAGYSSGRFCVRMLVVAFFVPRCFFFVQQNCHDFFRASWVGPDPSFSHLITLRQHRHSTCTNKPFKGSRQILATQKKHRVVHLIFLRLSFLSLQCHSLV